MLFRMENTGIAEPTRHHKFLIKTRKHFTTYKNTTLSMSSRTERDERI